MVEQRVPLATPQEVADWLQISTDKLRKLRARGNGPTFIKQPGTRDIRYAWADVHRWCNGNRTANSSNPEPTDSRTEGGQ